MCRPVRCDTRSGLSRLSDGVDLVSVAIGLFGFSHIILNLENEPAAPASVDCRDFQSDAEPEPISKPRSVPSCGERCSVQSLGVLPGGGAVLSSFASYSLEKRLASDPSRLGKERSKASLVRSRPTMPPPRPRWFR